MSSNSVGRSMKYYFQGNAHNSALNERCLLYSGINCSSDPLEATHEMERLVQKLGKDKRVQCHTILQSFSPDELSSGDYLDVQTAHDVGFVLANEILNLNSEHSEHMVGIFTQADNEHKLLYNHIVICNPSLDDGHALRGAQLRHFSVAKLSDEVCRELNINVSEKLPDTREQEIERSAVTSVEIMLRKHGKYSWKDDLRDRINQCLHDVHIHDFTGFTKALESKGVSVKAYRRDGVTPLKYTTYSFTDKNGKQRRARAHNLDNDFNLCNINKTLQ